MNKQNKTDRWEERITNLVKNNMWGLRCEMCSGGGWSFENEAKCIQCGGCGIFDWRVEPLISEFKSLLSDARREEREVVTKECMEIVANNALSKLKEKC